MQGSEVQKLSGKSWMYAEGMSLELVFTHLKSSLRWWMRLVYSFNTRTVSLHLIEGADSITAFWLSSARAALVLVLSPTEGWGRRERRGRGEKERRERGREREGGRGREGGGGEGREE